MTSDEQARVRRRNLSELETKVSAMGDFKVKLENGACSAEGLRPSAQGPEEQRQMHEEQARAAASATRNPVGTKATRRRQGGS